MNAFARAFAPLTHGQHDEEVERKTEIASENEAIYVIVTLRFIFHSKTLKSTSRVCGAFHRTVSISVRVLSHTIHLPLDSRFSLALHRCCWCCHCCWCCCSDICITDDALKAENHHCKTKNSFDLIVVMILETNFIYIRTHTHRNIQM